MKKVATALQVVLLAVIFIVAGTGMLMAQTSGDYRTHQSGNWNSVNTWEVYNGSTWVYPATLIPDSTNVPITNVITILSGHTVTFIATDTLRNVVVDQGGTLLDSLTTGDGKTADTMRIVIPGITINGTLTIAGNVTQSSGPYGIAYGKDSLHVGSTGVVNINEKSASTGTKGFLPAAVWATGSTLNINSLGGATASGWGAGGSQNFGTINYNVATQGTFGWGFAPGNVVSGDFTVSATGTGRLQFFGGSSGSVRINGNLTVTGGFVTGSGTSSSVFDTVYVMGNFKVTSGGSTGGFAVDRGSHGALNDGAGVVWYLYGDSVTVATTSTSSSNLANSNSQGGVYPYYLDSRFVLAKAGTQYVKIAPTTCTSTYGLNFDVINGSQVNIIATSNIIYLRLINGKIISPTATPLISGWYTGTALYSGTIENTSTSYVSGNLGILVATTSSVSKTFPIGKGSAYRPVTLSLTPSAATLSTFSAEMFNAAPSANTLPANFTRVSSVRYYNIAESGGGAAFANGIVTLNYDVDDGVTNAPALRVVKDDGAGNWLSLSGSGTANTTGSITTTAGFSDLTGTVFTLADSADDNPLPVEVTNFTATVQAGSVTLNWKTGSEINNAGFNVFRKGTGDADFVMVSSYLSNSALKGLGTSSVGKAYSFTDKDAHESGNYVYKLESVSTAGTSKAFTQLDVTVAVPKQFALFQNYPNPFNPTTTITYDVPKTSMVTIEVYDMLGNKVGTLVNETKAAGEYVATFDGSRLASGVYLYRMSAGNYSSVKKLLLMK